MFNALVDYKLIMKYILVLNLMPGKNLKINWVITT